MSENNPYAAPSSNLEQSPDVQGTVVLLPGPKRVAAGRGWGWITEGFGYFKRSPGGWILGMLVGFIGIILLQLIPIIGPIIYFLTIYVLVGGVMLGCHAQSQGQPFEVKYLFAAFKKPGKLMIISVLVILVSVAIMFAIYGPMYLQMVANPVSGADPEQALEMMGDPNTFMLKVLIGMLVFIPISMAVWFTPSLIAIHDVSIGQAIKLSFKGCLKNILPFLVFGLLGLVFYILAIIPLLLGLFVFFPTFTAANYIAYREIFTTSS